MRASVCSIFVLGFTCSASAEVDLQPSVSGLISGREEQLSVAVEPSLTTTVTQPYITVAGGGSARFQLASNADAGLSEWQSDISAVFLPRSQFYQFSLYQSHSETEPTTLRSRITTEQVGANVQVTLPITGMWSQVVSTSVDRSSVSIEDEPELARTNTGLRTISQLRMSDALTAFGDLNQIYSDSDFSSTQLSLGTQYNRGLNQLQGDLGFVVSETDLNEQQNIVAGVEVSRRFKRSRLEVGIRRSITDAISNIVVGSGLGELQQNSLVIADQFQLSVNDIRVTPNLMTNLSFNQVWTEQVVSIQDLTDEGRVQNGSIRIDTTYSLPGRAEAGLDLEYAWSGDITAETIGLNWLKQYSGDFSAFIDLQIGRTNTESDYQWEIGLLYEP